MAFTRKVTRSGGISLQIINIWWALTVSFDDGERWLWTHVKRDVVSKQNPCFSLIPPKNLIVHNYILQYVYSDM